MEYIAEKVVTFKMGSELFGISISYVKSIEKINSITKMPDLPIHIKGILNLRGEIIPIVDLRQFLLKTNPKYNEHNRIIVVKVDDTVAGLIVDEATEVLDIPSDLVSGVSLGGKELNRFFKVANINGNLIMIVDIVELIKFSDISRALEEIKNIL